MDIQRLKFLVGQGESGSLEFKKSTGELKPAFEALCGFLNGKGGIVLIGVTAQGRIQGQDVSDATQQEIAKEIRKLEPSVHVNVEYVLINDNKYVIVLEVEPGHHAPYAYDGRAFERLQSSKGRMTQHRYEQLLVHRGQLNHSWEEMRAGHYTVDNLDHNLILGTAREGVAVKRLPEEVLRQDISKILEGLKLVTDGHLKNAAIVLFAQELFPAYPQCHLKMARFKGLNRQEFLDGDQLHGNIFTQLENAMLFVKRHLPVAAKIEPGKIQRVETPLIPYDAIREVLINAICHRDYSAHGGSLALAIYDDRMEISNHGGLLPHLTLEKIKSGFSAPRNKLIANVLYSCKMIERWGRGVPGIISSCLGANDHEPEFVSDAVEFKVIFQFTASMKPATLRQQSPVHLSKRQREIIAILKQHKELKLKDILKNLELPPAERTLRDDLSALRAFGIIGSNGHAQTTHWFLVKSAKHT